MPNAKYFKYDEEHNLRPIYDDSVIEVVRCQFCKYYRSYYDMFKPYYDSPITEDEMHSGQCNYIGKRTGVYMEVNENDYCCYGERRETE